jgi:hypothetical protein
MRVQGNDRGGFFKEREKNCLFGSIQGIKIALCYFHINPYPMEYLEGQFMG